ncbi:TetR/AcrR family transcriptional regulator [Actinoplanes sp. NPDC051494]|uniref:TetR/AcrR family transcriptional regulator n=1 Tax=Actinoplanes sp. NPDC051494 TaxID=3363907 RepID=UPI00379FF3C6
MTGPAPRSPRRTEALSRERIVEATIELLDTAGETDLTVRALTAHLSTGRGAIYHHVTSKDDLLSAATDGVIGRMLTQIAADEDPERAIRALSLGIFNVIDAHPWAGRQLAREPWQPAVVQIWKGVGAQLTRLGITGSARSDAGSALVNYVLGAAAQYAAGARRAPDEAARQVYLETIAAEWAPDDLDPTPSFEHDDREQFLAGVDIFLAGITARR